MDPQASPSPKQQVVERVRAATNVLVTVSTNPSVDQLASAIGLTLMLNKLEKHATAVFSGQIPSTIDFLQPEETLEKNTDSLRDFIISLDKSKADKLRYKVENDVVRIFITPYRTSLSQSDLDFSQGDFNVDVVLALGVTQREQLDQAIVSHGRILHDATVITVTAGPAVSDLGAINWQDAGASSLSEMLVSISEAFQGGLLDGQISTAFLTGIVAETERFSNPKTSPKVMTMAAQLMAAGANQQLIATKLSVSFEKPEAAPADGAALPVPVTKVADDGSLAIHHQGEDDQEAEARVMETEVKKEEAKAPEADGAIHIDEHGTLMPASEAPKRKVVEPPEQGPPKTELSKLLAQEPEFGGTFTANSTSEGERTAQEQTSDALSLPPVNPSTEFPGDSPSPPSTQDGPPPDQSQSSEPPMPPMPPMPPSSPVPPAPPSTTPADDDDTLLDIEKSVHSPHLAVEGVEGVDAARDAVNSAINAAPYDPTRPEPIHALNATPMDLPLPGMPDMDSLVSASTAEVQGQGDTPGMPTAPPLPGDGSGGDEPVHGLLPITPPSVPEEDEGTSVDPFAAPPDHPDPTFGNPPLPPTDPSAPLDAPPPVPPPMMGFPLPPEDPDQK